ncbi:hypothetical protein B6N60_04221 [Richelia sinica FACHB-800]|uniref:Uncharacterized protein n=1 Tax=Richelia sinica FACHB-800 TaxID=1357546 RepID=A0A975TB15_9NOST|nr:hypothetical protein B6N60_04221 [Richelia sinica FACHB-800]
MIICQRQKQETEGRGKVMVLANFVIESPDLVAFLLILFSNFLSPTTLGHFHLHQE